MSTSGPLIDRERPEPPPPQQPPLAEKLPADLRSETSGLSGLGLAAGTATVIYLLASVALGTQVSGLLGSNVFSAVFVVCFVIAVTMLVVAVVLDIVLAKRGGQSTRTSVILGLLLLLPPTGVGFYVANQLI